jgi:hypothetical protein
MKIIGQDEKKQVCIVPWRDRDLKENLQWFSWKIQHLVDPSIPWPSTKGTSPRLARIYQSTSDLLQASLAQVGPTWAFPCIYSK